MSLSLHKNSSSNSSFPIVGILTGISYISGIDYYKQINENCTKILPVGSFMNRNPRLVLVSVDCDEYVALLESRNHEGVKEYLANGVDMLVKAGIDFLVIASNTGHLCLPEVEKRYPTLRVLHIVDCVAEKIKKEGFTMVGLLGTATTMREPFWKDRLALHGISVIVPNEEVVQEEIFSIIKNELSFNIFKPESRNYLSKQAELLVNRGASGVVLGCTELELLLQQDQCSALLYFSAQIHTAAISNVIARKSTLEDFIPTNFD